MKSALITFLTISLGAHNYALADPMYNSPMADPVVISKTSTSTKMKKSQSGGGGYERAQTDAFVFKDHEHMGAETVELPLFVILSAVSIFLLVMLFF